MELRASGKLYPICWGHYVVEEEGGGRRVYVCRQGHRFDGDFAAAWNLLLRYFKDLREQIRELLRSLGTWALGARPLRPGHARLAP